MGARRASRCGTSICGRGFARGCGLAGRNLTREEWTVYVGCRTAPRARLSGVPRRIGTRSARAPERLALKLVDRHDLVRLEHLHVQAVPAVVARQRRPGEPRAAVLVRLG